MAIELSGTSFTDRGIFLLFVVNKIVSVIHFIMMIVGVSRCVCGCIWFVKYKINIQRFIIIKKCFVFR